MKNKITWNKGAPPKRGVYRTRAGTNVGYRHWNGERWTGQCSTREYAAKLGRGEAFESRKCRTRFDIEWASTAKPRVIRDLTAMQIDEACSEVFHKDFPDSGDYDRAIAHAVLVAAGVRAPDPE